MEDVDVVVFYFVVESSMYPVENKAVAGIYFRWECRWWLGKNPLCFIKVFCFPFFNDFSRTYKMIVM